ncbi:hypothetical protein D3C83_235830 [compost metagenome]
MASLPRTASGNPSIFFSDCGSHQAMSSVMMLRNRSTLSASSDRMNSIATCLFLDNAVMCNPSR